MSDHTEHKPDEVEEVFSDTYSPDEEPNSDMPYPDMDMDDNDTVEVDDDGTDED